MVVIQNTKKAFTLVELMIVVAIIGVLATTLLPVLQGAQERARDGGRIASLNNVATALITFNSDEGVFPTSASSTATTEDTGSPLCLSNSDGKTATALGDMLKGKVAPLDPQRQNSVVYNNSTSKCGSPGAYGYVPLAKNQVARASFVLIADVETSKRANYDLGGVGGAASPTYITPDGNGAVTTGNTFEEWNTDGTRKISPVTVVSGRSAKDMVYVIFN